MGNTPYQPARGTRTITGTNATNRRAILNALIEQSEAAGFREIVLPSLEPAEMYELKAGAEVLNQMYVFPDKKGRQLCLRPEGTATCQALARTTFAREKDVQLWYEVRCWRYERPQAGRYREFTQFGIEVLNPTRDWQPELIALGEAMIAPWAAYERRDSVARGLAYYTAEGFEIICPSLGAQQQVLGGGSYDEGIGFALGLDRLCLANELRDGNGER